MLILSKPDIYKEKESHKQREYEVIYHPLNLP
jgi:hypothetical protein